MEESRNPDGPSYFERLRAVAELRYDDSVEEAAYQTVMEKIAACEGLVAQYEQTNGYQSQTVRDAVGEWAQAFRSDLARTRDDFAQAYVVVTQARRVMRQARDLFVENVSPELLSDGERIFEKIVSTGTEAAAVVVPIGGYLAHVAVETFFDMLKGQREDEREAYCKHILDQMNEKLLEGSAAAAGTRWTAQPEDRACALTHLAPSGARRASGGPVCPRSPPSACPSKTWRASACWSGPSTSR